MRVDKNHAIFSAGLALLLLGGCGNDAPGAGTVSTLGPGNDGASAAFDVAGTDTGSAASGDVGAAADAGASVDSGGSPIVSIEVQLPPKPIVVGDMVAVNCLARDATGAAVALDAAHFGIVAEVPLVMVDPAAGVNTVVSTKAGKWPVKCTLANPPLTSAPGIIVYVAGAAEKVAALLGPATVVAGDAGSKVSCELRDGYDNPTLTLKPAVKPGTPPDVLQFSVDAGPDLTISGMNVKSKKAGEHEVRCAVAAHKLLQVPAKLEVLPGPADFSKVTATPVTTEVDGPVQVKCAAYDAYGNAVLAQPSDFKTELPGHCTWQGESFSCTKAESFAIKCDSAQVNEAVPVEITILPGKPMSLELLLDPDKPNYINGQKIDVKGKGADQHGNLIDDVALADLALTPAGGQVDAVNAQIWFDFDGLYTVSAKAKDNPTVSASRKVRVDTAGPMLNVSSPARGATLYHTGKQKVVFTVADELSGLGEVTVNGVTMQVGDGIGASISIPTVYGLNIIKIVAADEWGNTSTLVQSFYAAKAFRPTQNKDGTKALVPSGLVAWLGQKVLDSGKHNHAKPKDIATVIEIVLKNLDTSMIVGQQFKVDASLLNATAKVTAFKFGNESINGGYPKITLTAVSGGLQLVGTIYSVDAKVNIKGKTLLFIPVNIDSDITATSMTVSGLIKISVSASGKVTAKTQNVKVKLNNLSVKIANGWGFLVNWLISLFNGTITAMLENELSKQIGAAIDGPLGNALQSFAINTQFNVPGFFGGSPTAVTLASALQSMSFKGKVGAKAGGGQLAMKAAITSVKQVKHDILGALMRQKCMAGGQTVAGMKQIKPMELALHFDLVNQMLAAIWQAGSLAMNVDSSSLGAFDFAKYGVNDLKVTTDFLLPPLINDCTKSGAPEMQLGDIRLDIVAQMGGKPVVLKVYVSAAAKVDVKAVPGPQGNEIALDMDAAHLIEGDVDSVLVGGEAASEGTVNFFEALLPVITNLLIEQFKGTLASFPLPEIDLTLLSQSIPKGTTIAIDVQQVYAGPGNVYAEGDVK